MDKSFLNKIQQIIVEHLDNEKLNVENLAFKIGLSRSQLLRKIKALTGKSANQLIRETRLNESLRLIKEGNYTTSEISYRVGFSSPSYFNKCFHDYFGLTPGDYKAENEKSYLSDMDENSGDLNPKSTILKTDETIKIQDKSAKRTKFIIASLLVLLIITFSYSIYTKYANETILFEKKITKKTIAVLPFKDMSPQDTQWFCDGVTDNILSKLSNIKGLTVISRTSSDTYKNTDKKIPRIAKELGVTYIIEGSVTRLNNEIRINTQLINANDEHMWSKEYTNSFEEIFSIQQNVAKQIAEQLQINLTLEEEKRIDYKPTDNLQALKLFQKGLILADDNTLKGLESSIEFYEKAIELDPNYAEAYAEIANSYYLMDGFGKANRKKIHSYIKKAFAINPNNVRAYTVMAMVNLKEENWKKAKEYFDKAIVLNPNDAIARYHYAKFLYSLANPDRDIKNYLVQLSIAQKLDPLSTPINEEIIWALLVNDKVEEAEEHLKKVSFSLTDKARKMSKQRIVNKKCKIISLKNKDWTAAIKFYKNAIEEEPNNPYLFSKLGNVYDAVLNDDINCVKYFKKAYQLDSTNCGIALNFNFALIESGNFNESKKLMETKNYKSLIANDREFYELYSSFYYHYFNKDYNKAQEILSGTLKSEFYFDKINILARLGKTDEVYKLLRDHAEMDITNKAFIFASLEERDSMYYYLNKEEIDFWWVNSRFEFDPYRKEERYKTFLKNNYLPITHWNK